MSDIWGGLTATEHEGDGQRAINYLVRPYASKCKSYVMQESRTQKGGDCPGFGAGFISFFQTMIRLDSFHEKEAQRFECHVYCAIKW